MSWGLVRQGSQLLRQGQLERAIDLLERGAQGLPGLPGPLIQLGLGYLEAGRAAEARATLEKAAELAPANPAAAMFASLACSDLGEAQPAQVWLDRARALSPANQALPTLEALLRLRQGRVIEGLRALGLAGAEPESLWSQPDLAASAPLASRVVLELERLRLPLDVPRLEHSQVAEEPTATPTARRFPLLVLYSLGALIPMLAMVLGMLYVMEGDPLWLRMLGLLAGIVLLSAYLIYRRSSASQFPTWRARSVQKRGLSLLEQALGQTPGRLRQRLLEHALSKMREASTLAPDLFRADFYLGEALLFAGQMQSEDPHEPERAREYLEQADQCFLRSWGQDGGNPYLFYYMARTNLLLGRVQAAQGYFEKALERFEKLPEGHYGIGQCRLLQHDEEGGRRALWQAVSGELLMVRERLHDMERLALTRPELLGRPWPVMPPEPPAPVAEEPVEEPAAI